jgi:hypothetical protein
MKKGKQILQGETMRAFFRAYVQRETPLDDTAADKLAETLNNAITRMVVSELPEGVEISDTKSGGKRSASPKEPFNPYRFSAIVVLTKSGRDGLLDRLREIKSAKDLRTFAEAQHVPVSAKIRRIEDIRKAIVAAAEQRLADRKAAAS